MAQSRLPEFEVRYRVLDEDREPVGQIFGIRDGRVDLDLVPDVTDSILTTLGWATIGSDHDIDSDHDPQDRSHIDAIDDEEFRRKR